MADGPAGLRLRVLSAGAPQTGVNGCIDAFRRAAGDEVEADFATAPAIREKVEGGAAGADIVIAPVTAIRDFENQGLTVAGTSVVIGGVKAAVVVRSGAEAPDISSAEALKAALLAAGSVVYNEASSGVYIARMLERLGIAGAVAPKTVRVASAAAVMEHLAASRAAGEIGFGQLPEIRRFEDRGVTLVGPLPREVENVTVYAAALLADSKSPAPARSFIEFLTTPRAKEIFAAAGVE